MVKRKGYKNFLHGLFFFIGLSVGIISIWPGILKDKNRRCFINVVQDGSDGKVSIGTFLSIDPNYLLKINNAKNKYKKILYIGDYCFRR